MSPATLAPAYLVGDRDRAVRVVVEREGVESEEVERVVVETERASKIRW